MGDNRTAPLDAGFEGVHGAFPHLDDTVRLLRSKRPYWSVAPYVWYAGGATFLGTLFSCFTTSHNGIFGKQLQYLDDQSQSNAVVLGQHFFHFQSGRLNGLQQPLYVPPL